MKRITAVIAILAVLMLFSSCGGSEEKDTSSERKKVKTVTTIRQFLELGGQSYTNIPMYGTKDKNIAETVDIGSDGTPYRLTYEYKTESADYCIEGLKSPPLKMVFNLPSYSSDDRIDSFSLYYKPEDEEALIQAIIREFPDSTHKEDYLAGNFECNGKKIAYMLLNTNTMNEADFMPHLHVSTLDIKNQTEAPQTTAPAVTSAPTTTEALPQYGNVVTNGDNLNMRSGAGTEYDIVGKIPNGTYVEILEASGNWFKVSYEGKTGWVSGDYLNIRM